MSVQIVVFYRRFIVIRQISILACFEKGTFHCLAYKEESKKRDSDERNYFLRAKSGRRSARDQGERVAKSCLEDEKKREKGRGGEGKRWMNEEEATFARRKNRVAKWSAGYRVTERQELYCFAIELERKGDSSWQHSSFDIQSAQRVVVDVLCVM